MSTVKTEPDYELSENQEQFVEDAKRQGFEVDYSYSGRGMYGEQCPCIKVDSPGEFATEANIHWDQLGLRHVLYARH